MTRLYWPEYWLCSEAMPTWTVHNRLSPRIVSGHRPATPDVIALEVDMAGVMPGKDVINMIKATMEWVDIPIILYTRAPISGQQEARTIHGADELVPKGPGGGPQALVTRVISVFRRP